MPNLVVETSVNQDEYAPKLLTFVGDLWPSFTDMIRDMMGSEKFDPSPLYSGYGLEVYGPGYGCEHKQMVVDWDSETIRIK